MKIQISLMKRLIRSFLPILLFLSIQNPGQVYAKDEVSLYFFWGNGCPHCNKEKLFLEKLKMNYPQLDIRSFEVWNSMENAVVFSQMSEAYGKKIEGVPATFIGDFEPITGYLSDDVTGRIIEERIKQCIEKGCIDPGEKMIKSMEKKAAPEEKTKTTEDLKEGIKPAVQEEKKIGERPLEKKEGKETKYKKEEPAPEVPGKTKEAEPSIGKQRTTTPEEGLRVNIPVIGEIDTSKTSLPLLTIIIAGMDGFNPCAFFVLFLLLSILIYARSRKVMFLIGGTFVFFSGFIYFLFMAAWLNIFLLIGELKAITVAAGLIALLIASINIKDFFLFKKGVSLSIPEKAKPKLYERIRNLLKKSSLPSMMFGTVILAIAANSYELLCTAGFPMVYTRALTLNSLPMLNYYLYLAMYNVIYVIPLAAIVIIFSVTLGAKKLTERQGQILKLISGMMMFFLGLVLLIKPSLLNNIIVSVGLLALSLAVSWIIIIAFRQFGKTD